MKKCIVYGAGRHAEMLIITLIKDGYVIEALCDSDNEKVGLLFDGKYPIISKEVAITKCEEDPSIHLIIGASDGRYQSEILRVIKEEFPAHTSVPSENEIKNRVQASELESFYHKMRYKWDVDLNCYFNNWIDNLDTEIDFWLYNGIDARSESSAVYRDMRRLNRKEVLFKEPDLGKYVKSGDVLMDIGCALVSGFGEKIPDGYINVLSVDPLAYYYNFMNSLDNLAIEKTYRCSFGMFELISDIYGSEFADLIFIRNSMDHSFDPYRGLVKCIYTLKTGGVMKLQHQRAEAVHENWIGLHNWNFDCINNEFVIWNKENAVNVSKQLSDIADIEVRYEEKQNRDDQWIDVLIKKKREFDISEFLDDGNENMVMAGFISRLFERMATDGKRFQEKLLDVCL